jgi:hypothetical protein
MPDSNIDLKWISTLVTAIGGLGLAASALVDTSKALPGGGVSAVGFQRIVRAVGQFLPGLAKGGTRSGEETNLTTSLLPILRANWINGLAASDQREAARALIKMELKPSNAGTMAKVAEVDADLLAAVATKVNTGEALSDEEKNVLGRFDLALASILDAAYQEASQRYRNVSKTWAGVVAVAMGVFGSIVAFGHWDGAYVAIGAACGVLAVPLAPITKDLVSALSAGVQVAQAARRKT